MTALACTVANGTVRLFSDSRMVLALVIASGASLLWSVVSPSELAATLFLSILALALTCAILFVGETREVDARRRDEALHAKLDGLLVGVPDADDALAGIERN